MNPIDKNQNKRNILFSYTIFFSILSFLVFLPFIISGKTFVFIFDGIQQHLVAYMYYGRLIREILHNIFVLHTFQIPMYDFNVGYGSDIIQTFNYYVIGDPFAFFSFLVPEKYTYIFYGAMNILRLYLAGMAFIFLCFESGIISKFANISGAFLYCFYFYALINVSKHPFFLNPVVFFPLVIIGIERVIKGKSPFVFIISAFLSAASNFYFFYMIVILAMIFAFVRLFSSGENYRFILQKIFHLFCYSIISVLMAAVIFVPTVYFFLADPRLGGFSPEILYPISYYFNLPFSYFSLRDDFWLTLSFPIFTVYGLFIELVEMKNCTKYGGFGKLNHRTLHILVFTCVIFSLFPVFGQVLNGFSYSSNRWNWAFSLLVAFIFISNWENIIYIERKKLLRFSGSVVALALFFLFAQILKKHDVIEKPYFRFFVVNLIIFVLFSLILLFIKNTSKKEKFIFAFICLFVISSCDFFYTKLGYNDFLQCLNRNELDVVFNNESSEMKEFSKDDGDFFRFTANDFTENASVISKIPSTQFYWSISNGCISDFNEFMEIAGNWKFRYSNLDERAIPVSLSSVKYFYLKNDSELKVPNGFKKTENENIFVNENFLPLGFCYDSYRLRPDVEKMALPLKQEIMLSSLVAEDSLSGLSENENLIFESEKKSFKLLSSDKNVEVISDSFIVSEENGFVDLEIDCMEDSELYLTFRNFVLTPKSKDLTYSMVSVSTDRGYSKSFSLSTKNFEWYHGQKNFTLNLGVQNSNKTIVRINFQEKGKYSFDEIEIYSYPLKNLSSKISLMKENVLENVKLETNKVSGKVSCSKNSVLCLTIPYHKGWKAYVDGNRAKIIKGNIMFSAIELEKGEHDIVLKYETPFLKIGAVLSLLGFIAFGLLHYLWHRFPNAFF